MAISNIETVNYYGLREQVRQYIERCHLDDGGYFFAHMTPSSAMDTYYAVKTLSMLDLRDDRPEETKRFFQLFLRRDSFFSVNGLFSAAEVLHVLGGNITPLHKYLPKLRLLRNDLGGFGVVKNLDIEVVSVLESTYRVLTILDRLGIGCDKKQIIEFALKFNNADGGFGSGHISTLASTFYATEILRFVGYTSTESTATKKYLRSRENIWQLNFIEDMYWLSGSLSNLNEKTQLCDWIVRFVTACQRTNGGFARKDVMGIPTLEYTYYAVSILKTLEPTWLK
jgi:hypothetical protein